MADEEARAKAEEYAQNAQVLTRIDELARRAKFSRASLAQAAGINPNMVGAWYKRFNDGEAPAIKATDAFKIALVLGVSVEQLLTGDGPELRPREYDIAEKQPLVDWISDMDRDQVMKLSGVLSIVVPQAGLPPIAAQATAGAKKEKRAVS